MTFVVEDDDADGEDDERNGSEANTTVSVISIISQRKRLSSASNEPKQYDEYMPNHLLHMLACYLL